MSGNDNVARISSGKTFDELQAMHRENNRVRRENRGRELSFHWDDVTHLTGNNSFGVQLHAEGNIYSIESVRTTDGRLITAEGDH